LEFVASRRRLMRLFGVLGEDKDKAAQGQNSK